MTNTPNKQYIVIGSVIAVVLAGIVGFFIFKGNPKQEVQPVKKPVEEQTVIPTVGSEVTVEVKPLQNGKKVLLTLSGIPDSTKSIDYELTYETKDGGLQGVSSTLETNGKDSYEKDFLLGTCSSGGACIYHQVSGPIKVSLKFNGSYGERIFEKEYEL